MSLVSFSGTKWPPPVKIIKEELTTHKKFSKHGQKRTIKPHKELGFDFEVLKLWNIQTSNQSLEKTFKKAHGKKNKDVRRTPVHNFYVNEDGKGLKCHHHPTHGSVLFQEWGLKRK